MTDTTKKTMLFWALSLTVCAQAAKPVRAENIHDKRFERERNKEIKKIEKCLATRGDGTDETTWYVIHFIDQALRTENYYTSPFGRRYYTSTATDASQWVMILGKRPAAEKIFEFQSRVSIAAQKLLPTPYPNVVEIDKRWEHRAFRSGAEAEALYRSLNPSKTP